MTTRDTAPIGAPCWVDLTTSDAARAAAFYGTLFGWTAEEPNPQFGGYFNFRRNDERTAGCMQAVAGVPAPADAWSIYLATDDAAKTVELAEANGGHVVSPPMAVMELGTMAVLTDPDGARIGVWQPGTHPGFRTVYDDNAPGWFELHTRKYDVAVRFYRDVFRWSTQTVGDTADFRYTVQRDGEDQLAGIMDATGFLPEGAPASWAVYFGVADADAALATIVDLGGSVLRPAEDTPYGRLAEAADPMGAHFKLVAPNAAMPAGSRG